MQSPTITMIRLIALMYIAIKAPIFVLGILSPITWYHPECHHGTLIKTVIDGWQTQIKEWSRFFFNPPHLFLKCCFPTLSEYSNPTYFPKGQLKWVLSHEYFLSCSPAINALFSPVRSYPQGQWTYVSLLDCEHLVSRGQVWLTFIPLVFSTETST